MTLDIKRQLLAVGTQDDLDLDTMLARADLWDVYGDFRFNGSGSLLNLSTYLVLPYVFGGYEIQMLWDYFQDKINESFQGTSFARLIGARFDEYRFISDRNSLQPFEVEDAPR